MCTKPSGAPCQRREEASCERDSSNIGRTSENFGAAYLWPNDRSTAARISTRPSSSRVDRMTASGPISARTISIASSTVLPTNIFIFIGALLFVVSLESCSGQPGLVLNSAGGTQPGLGVNFVLRHHDGLRPEPLHQRAHIRPHSARGQQHRRIAHLAG